MKYLVGTDEAGYGPNLGPLVISATLWETPSQVDCEELFEQVQSVIAPALDKIKAGGPFVVMADSKVLYTPGKGLRHLERGLWAALGLLGFQPTAWRDVWQALAPEALDAMATVPWYADHDEPAPFDADAAEMATLVASLREGLAAAGVRLVAVRSRVIFEGEFNDLVEQHGLKSTALSHETLALAARMIEPLQAGSISMVCDKHGGRKPLWIAAGRAFSRTSGRGARRRTRAEPLSLWPAGTPHRRLFPHEGRIVFAGCVGLDGLKVSARIGDAGH